MLLKYCPIALRAAGCLLHNTRNLQTQPKAVNQLSFLVSQRFYSKNNNNAIGIVDYATVKKLANEPQKLLIDVREPDELKETGQIPSSINIPLGNVSQELAVSDQLFKSKYGRNKPKSDTEIIFHCKIGKRSLKAAEAANALGYKNVKNYEGSWLDWAKNEGLPK
ncbi:rhodanese domain-containing protein CG4456 [Drosophila innubila]|uniref:rhodanese domain-containing protein CG4456 n=1 Tax=Drosophila innubila TaxID=198719 RepID=UPI00148C84E9|nr:rhodanese domain-containing protein CG4456 [Drosophila innubila]